MHRVSYYLIKLAFNSKCGAQCDSQTFQIVSKHVYYTHKWPTDDIFLILTGGVSEETISYIVWWRVADDGIGEEKNINISHSQNPQTILLLFSSLTTAKQRVKKGSQNWFDLPVYFVYAKMFPTQRTPPLSVWVFHGN